MCKYSLLLASSISIRIAVAVHGYECLIGDRVFQHVEEQSSGKTQYPTFGDVSLLQKSFPSARRSRDHILVEDMEYGFPVTKRDLLQNTYLHWDGNLPYRPRVEELHWPHTAYFGQRVDANEQELLGRRHPMKQKEWLVVVILVVVGCVILSLLCYVLAGGLGPSAADQAKAAKAAAMTKKQQVGPTGDGNRSGTNFFCCGVSERPSEELLTAQMAEENTVVVTFQPGKHGLEIREGIVTDVEKGGQAQQKGVKVGWKVVAVGNEKCESFDAKKGSVLFESYRITFEIDEEEVVLDIATVPPIELDEDTFGMSVCSLTRDFYFISMEGGSFARYLRLFKSLFLLILTIVIQVLLLSFSQFVSARSVHEIRESYDTFEIATYGKEHTTLTPNGKHRGILAFRPPFEESLKRLNDLSEDDRDAVCRIPLSQPLFFALLLLVWSLTCLTEIRKAFELQTHILMLETVPSMAHSMRHEEDAEDEGKCDIIRGMTTYMKLLITITMFVPRVAITVFLLWVGCRWLLATTDFADLIMNAVALEFVLLIKEALYVALVTARSRIDLKNTLIEPYPKTIPPTWFNLASTLLILAVACLWVFLYMVYFQMVLPGYNWDVHDVCLSYIQERYST